MNYRLLKKDDMQTEDYPGGKLIWYASERMGQKDITLGFCIINKGGQNMLHLHPNCVETLHVLKGKILHTIGNERIEMAEGDSITIEKDVPHNAVNIGDTDAVLHISFTSANRQTTAIRD